MDCRRAVENWFNRMLGKTALVKALNASVSDLTVTNRQLRDYASNLEKDLEKIGEMIGEEVCASVKTDVMVWEEDCCAGKVKRYETRAAVDLACTDVGMGISKDSYKKMEDGIVVMLSKELSASIASRIMGCRVGSRRSLSRR